MPGTPGLGLLVALVVGPIMGSGIVGLPQDMAAVAGAGAIVIGRIITGAGMLMLARVFQEPARRRPDLDNGVHAYVQASSHEYRRMNTAA